MPYRDPDNQDIGDLETGTRVCKGCGVRKPMTDFYHTNKKPTRRRKCKACVARMRDDLWAQDPSRRVNHDLKVRSNYYRRTYGISLEEVQELIGSQGGCAICGSRLELMTSSSVSTAHVDHDHETGAVRGILCFLCNTAIGKLKDDPYLCRRAADYLEGK